MPKTLEDYTTILNGLFEHYSCDDLVRSARLVLGQDDLAKLYRRKAARKRFLTNVKKDFDEWWRKNASRYHDDPFAVYAAGRERGR